jgi:hypothetical protein
MKGWQSQAQVNWDCKYRVVILPKSRRKAWYARMRQSIGQILRDLCRQKHIGLVGGKALQRDQDQGGLNFDQPDGPFKGPSSYRRLAGGS